MRVHKPLQGQRRFRLRMQGAYEHRYSPERNAAADEPVTQLCDHLVGLHCGSRTIDEPIHNRPYIATRHYTRPSCANCDGGSHRTQQPGRNKLKTRTDATGTIQRVRMLNWSLMAHPVDSRQRSTSVAFRSEADICALVFAAEAVRETPGGRPGAPGRRGVGRARSATAGLARPGAAQCSPQPR